MGAFDGMIKWIAEHAWAVLIIIFVLLALLLGFTFTAQGKDLLALFAKHPVLILIFISPFALALVIYVWSLRPKDTQAQRLGFNATWDAFVKQSKEEIDGSDFIAEDRHPSCGKLFSGKIYLNYKPLSILIDDTLIKAGEKIRTYKGILSDVEITKEFKKSMSLDEMAQTAKQFDARIEQFKKNAERKEEAANVGWIDEGEPPKVA